MKLRERWGRLTLWNKLVALGSTVSILGLLLAFMFWWYPVSSNDVSSASIVSAEKFRVATGKGQTRSQTVIMDRSPGSAGPVHLGDIHGALSCFDRMLFRGSLPIMSGGAMAEFLQANGVHRCGA